MTRIIWITDPHLNFVRPLAVREFLDDVAEREPAAVLIGGDIGEAHNVVAYLEQVDELWQRPVHFVLGNHDFYRGSIAGVRREIDRLCERRPLLNYLSHRGVVELTSKLGLVGHDGWADARVGDYEHSTIMMNDYKLIAELSARSGGTWVSSRTSSNRLSACGNTWRMCAAAASPSERSTGQRCSLLCGKSSAISL